MSRGGARPGAGRKAKDGQKRVTITLRVLPSTRELIRQMRSEGIRMGEMVDTFADAWASHKHLDASH
jgi:hypothetical protein